jgi:hypothetical protein
MCRLCSHVGCAPYGEKPLGGHLGTSTSTLSSGWQGTALNSRKKRVVNLPAPYLRPLWLDPSRVTDREADPFCLPNAQLLRLGERGLEPVTLEATEHFRLMWEFCADPASFLETMLAD